jgi:Na+-driven multidrug efflux pump
MAGVTNILLDALLVGILSLGIVGAAAATALSQFVGGVIPLIYFGRKNSSILKLGKTRFYGKTLIKVCINGSSELMSNISSSVVTLLYNGQLLYYIGEDGIAAYGVIMYVCFVFVSIFIGFVIGAAPIVGYNYGANNRVELSNIFRKSVILVGIGGALMLVVAMLSAVPLSMLFVGYDKALYELTLRGFIIFSLHYIFAGFNIFSSAFFTALNNGVISAVISFLRTLVFQCITVLLLPLIMGVDGIWFSVVIAEALTFAVTLFFIVIKRKKYGYA